MNCRRNLWYSVFKLLAVLNTLFLPSCLKNSVLCNSLALRRSAGLEEQGECAGAWAARREVEREGL
jgi:hypothetical protein